MNSTRQQVAVVVGTTSKWQADGHNTKYAKQFLHQYQCCRLLFATRYWCRISRIPELSDCWRRALRCQWGRGRCLRSSGRATGAYLLWIALAEEESYVDRPGGICVLYACSV